MRTVRRVAVSAVGGGCFFPGGACSWGVGLVWVGMLPPGGWVLPPRGYQLRGRVPAPGGVVSQHALRQTPLLVNRMTDRCKNITFATLLWTVIKTESILNYRSGTVNLNMVNSKFHLIKVTMKCLTSLTCAKLKEKMEFPT